MKAASGTPHYDFDIMTINGIGVLYMDDIYVLDLESTKLKLMSPSADRAWGKEKCLEVEIEYKRFLALKRLFMHKNIVPHRDIDQFWKQHMLDHKKYTEDCQNIFGHYLNYSPDLFNTKHKDVQNKVLAFEETKKIYRDYFGQEYVDFARPGESPET